jgi:Bifunctional DNA primase/polymerase, N-terminal
MLKMGVCLEEMVKIGVTFPKENVKLPSKWNELKKSRYNGEKNYAVLCGKVNNVLVVDLDKKEDTFKGLKWFEDNIGKLNEINTFVTKTINGGYHIYFKYTKKLKNTNNANNMHIDILSDNKCCYQGEGYQVLVDIEIRDLTEEEIIRIQSLSIKKNVKNDSNPAVTSYKRANVLLSRPENTVWDVIKMNTGFKAVPNCRQCLIDPTKEHTHDNHSALFINNDKSVVKSCYSCGSEVLSRTESKKVINVFNVIMNVTTQENTVYQDLVKDLLGTAKTNLYKREKITGIVYKQIKPYAYVKYLEPMDFLNEKFLGDEDFKSNVNNMDNLIKFMKQYNDHDFPFLEYDNDYLGFRNGVLNIVTCEFTEIPLRTLVVKKYFDMDFKYSIETPLFNTVLDHQFDSKVRDFIYICLGRMFGIRDNFGFMLYLLGEPGCGKSLIIDVLCECFNNVGAIGNSFEEKFGLSFLYDKDIIVCDDLPKNISKVFPQQTFQTCVTGGKIPIAVKGGVGFTVDWLVPMLLAGNWFPDYIDKGQISRRMLVANFERNVSNPDPTLKERILNEELPAFIYKCLLFYKKLLDEKSKKDIWALCPEYFVEQQLELKIERNPLFKYLLENTRHKEGEVILLDEIRTNFNNWLGKKVNKLDNGTFGQVNNRYTIEQIITCTFCGSSHKKGCCERYNRVKRSTKRVVRNLVLIM